MTHLLALFLALAPQPKASPTDDFNEVVTATEAANRCEAVKFYKAEDDAIRLVVFRCAQGEVVVPFVLKGKDGWYPVRQFFREPGGSEQSI